MLQNTKELPRLTTIPSSSSVHQPICALNPPCSSTYLTPACPCQFGNQTISKERETNSSADQVQANEESDATTRGKRKYKIVGGNADDVGGLLTTTDLKSIDSCSAVKSTEEGNPPQFNQWENSGKSCAQNTIPLHPRKRARRLSIDSSTASSPISLSVPSTSSTPSDHLTNRQSSILHHLPTLDTAVSNLSLSPQSPLSNSTVVSSSDIPLLPTRCPYCFFMKSVKSSGKRKRNNSYDLDSKYRVTCSSCSKNLGVCSFGDYVNCSNCSLTEHIVERADSPSSLENEMHHLKSGPLNNSMNDDLFVDPGCFNNNYLLPQHHSNIDQKYRLNPVPLCSSSLLVSNGITGVTSDVVDLQSSMPSQLRPSFSNSSLGHIKVPPLILKYHHRSCPLLQPVGSRRTVRRNALMSNRLSDANREIVASCGVNMLSALEGPETSSNVDSTNISDFIENYKLYNQSIDAQIDEIFLEDVDNPFDMSMSTPTDRTISDVFGSSQAFWSADNDNQRVMGRRSEEARLGSVLNIHSNNSTFFGDEDSEPDTTTLSSGRNEFYRFVDDDDQATSGIGVLEDCNDDMDWD